MAFVPSRKVRPRLVVWRFFRGGNRQHALHIDDSTQVGHRQAALCGKEPWDVLEWIGGADSDAEALAWREKCRSCIKHLEETP